MPGGSSIASCVWWRHIYIYIYCPQHEIAILVLLLEIPHVRTHRVRHSARTQSAQLQRVAHLASERSRWLPSPAADEAAVAGHRRPRSTQGLRMPRGRRRVPLGDGCLRGGRRHASRPLLPPPHPSRFRACSTHLTLETRLRALWLWGLLSMPLRCDRGSWHPCGVGARRLWIWGLSPGPSCCGLSLLLFPRGAARGATPRRHKSCEFARRDPGTPNIPRKDVPSEWRVARTSAHKLAGNMASCKIDDRRLGRCGMGWCPGGLPTRARGLSPDSVDLGTIWTELDLCGHWPLSVQFVANQNRPEFGQIWSSHRPNLANT